VLERPPEAAVLDECKTGMFGREPFATETAERWAALLVDSMLYGLPSYRRSFRLDRIERLMPQGVFEAARRHIDPDRLRVTVGLPAGCRALSLSG
jgi:predicted Zn-dependent peptidase